MKIAKRSLEIILPVLFFRLVFLSRAKRFTEATAALIPTFSFFYAALFSNVHSLWELAAFRAVS